MLETKKKSLAEVTVDLGYKSPSTLVHWFRNERIPYHAVSKVQDYLKKVKHERHARR